MTNAQQQPDSDDRVLCDARPEIVDHLNRQDFKRRRDRHRAGRDVVDEENDEKSK